MENLDIKLRICIFIQKSEAGQMKLLTVVIEKGREWQFSILYNFYSALNYFKKKADYVQYFFIDTLYGTFL